MGFAMLFPGQGSQAVGMLLQLPHPEIATTYAEASEHLGWDLAGLIAEGPEAQLNQTERTQPALLAASVALWRVWRAAGLPAPSALAGHSLGEYSALVAAGSLDFGEALRLVALRGQLMQTAVPEGEGAMLAVIGLDDEAVAALCERCPAEGVLVPANYNAPGQVVVAGARAAVDWLEAEGKAAGARMLVRLPVSVPSHSPLMRSAAEHLAERLGTIAWQLPSIPVVHNVDGRRRGDLPAIRAALESQLHQPVRWTETITGLVGEGITQFVECGPGKVLAGLNKRINKQTVTVALDEADGLDKARALLAV